MRKTILVVPAIATILLGCSRAEPTPEANPLLTPATVSCDVMFATGTKITTSKALSHQSCLDDKGEGHAYAVGVYKCRDGRSLLWNDLGWGYTDGVFTRHASDRKTPPEAEDKACLQ